MKKQYVWKRALILLCSLGLVVGAWMSEAASIHGAESPTIGEASNQTDESIVEENSDGADDTDVTNDSASEKDNGSSSIGIIGGADGPTVIMVAGSFGSVWIVVGAVVVIAAIVVAVLLLRKERNKKV